jgi:Cyclophilin-like family
LRSSRGTPIRVIFGDTVITARPRDNATARDLAAQLPLTLTFSDLNNVGFWNGIVRIGEFDGDVDAIERQSDDFSVTIERAE